MDKREGLVNVEVEGEVGRITFNRPGVHNAVNTPLIKDIISAVQYFESLTSIKVVVFDGAGPSFCAGFDLSQFKNSSPEEMRAGVEEGYRLVQTISNMRPITIASVHGHCIGGGMVLMMACDFRHAASNSSFCLPEADLGIPLAWGAVPWMVREVGALVTTELILSCRTLSAKEALEKGLVNGVCDVDELPKVVGDLSNRLRSHSMMILESTKRQVSAARQQLCSDDYGFYDAHLLYSALLDKQAEEVRGGYLV